MDEAAWLTALPNWAFAFALVLTRSSLVVMLMPGLGEMEAPALVRAGISLSFAILLTPVIGQMSAPDHPMNAAGMIGAEMIVGACLGWLSRLPVLALGMSGALMSYMLGLSSVIQYDPALGGQSSALSRAFGMAGPVILLNSGLITLPIAALAGSYDLFPPGTLLPSADLTEQFTAALVECFALALRLSSPFIIAALLLQAGLALLARLVPQLQLYTAAMPGQILGGLTLLGALISTILFHWSDAVQASWSRLPGL